jgi:hypothetical protein
MQPPLWRSNRKPKSSYNYQYFIGFMLNPVS